jgi:hypothetical protein
LQVTLFANLFHFDFFSTLGFLSARHGWSTKWKENRRVDMFVTLELEMTHWNRVWSGDFIANLFVSRFNQISFYMTYMVGNLI